MVAAIYSCPKDPRCVRIGKESHAFKAHFKWRGFDRRQRYFYLLHHGILNVANKLQCDVQTFNTGQAPLWRKRACAFHVVRKACANIGRDIECNEDAHCHISVRRTMSRACCVAQWRMRSRSPGKVRSMTSV